MQKITVPAGWLWLTFVPLIAHAYPQQTGRSDCKLLTNHSGFAEFVMPAEGGTHKLPMKVSPSVKWNVHNTDYIDWIEILDGDSGMGPGTMTIRLGANTGKYCRVGVLTIFGVQSFFGSPMRVGSPIRILQPGTVSAEAKEQAKPSLPTVIDLPPPAAKDPQAPGKPKSRWILK